MIIFREFYLHYVPPTGRCWKADTPVFLFLVSFVDFKKFVKINLIVILEKKEKRMNIKLKLFL